MANEVKVGGKLISRALSAIASSNHSLMHITLKMTFLRVAIIVQMPQPNARHYNDRFGLNARIFKSNAAITLF